MRTGLRPTKNEGIKMGLDMTITAIPRRNDLEPIGARRIEKNEVGQLQELAKLAGSCPKIVAWMNKIKAGTRWAVLCCETRQLRPSNF